MAGALPNGGVLAVQDPYKQQKCNWFRRRTGEGGEVEMLNKTRKRIYALGEQLGKKADDLVLRRKTSFIALSAKAFMGREVEQDPRKAKIEKYLSEATNMEQTYGTVSILKEGTEVKMSVSDQKLKMNEEQTDGRSKNTMKLAEFLEGQNSSSNGKSSNNQMTGKKRKRAKIQPEEKDPRELPREKKKVKEEEKKKA